MADVICPDEVIIVRYVHSLTDDQRELLAQTMKADTSFRARARAHSLLLSDQGTPIKDIAKTYHVDRDTVSSWITNWEHHGAQSLHDKPRSGRPSKLTLEEQALAQQYIKEEPRALKGVVERLATKTAKRISISSLKRLAKKARLRWKRVRKSLKRFREPEAFARCQRELDVRFISSLPVMQRPACKVWADKRPVQIVWAVRSTRPDHGVVDDACG